MTSVALLHFEGDAGALVMYMASPHRVAYGDVHQIMVYLKGKVDNDIQEELNLSLLWESPGTAMQRLRNRTSKHSTSTVTMPPMMRAQTSLMLHWQMTTARDMWFASTSALYPSFLTATPLTKA